MKKSKVEFSIPDDVAKSIGESIKPGSNLELMVNFRVKDDGKWCIAAVEGVPFPGFTSEGEPDEEKEESYDANKSEFADKYQEAMKPKEGEMAAMEGQMPVM